MRFMQRIRTWSLTASAGGSLMLLDGCDPGVQQAVEDGIINVANSFLSSMIQAVLQLNAEQAMITTLVPGLF